MRSCTYRARIVSPAFTGGYSPEQPELRASTVRGQIRWWLRALGADADLEKRVFGGVHGKAQASAVRLRVAGDPAPPTPAPVLPHKHQGHPRPALQPDTEFALHLIERPLGQSGGTQFDIAEITLQIWLYLGAMGFRSNRGGGSVWPSDGPASATELRARLTALRKKASVLGLWGADSRLGRGQIDLHPSSFARVDDARKVCTDTVHDPDGLLGYVRGRDRQGSPLKVKIVPMPEEGPLRILRVALPFRSFAPDEGLKRLTAHGKRLGEPGVVLV